MVFRLNIVVSSLCIVIVIGLSVSATYASEDKSKPPHIIQLQPVDVMSTSCITIHSADSAHIHPGEAISCTVSKSVGHHLVHCRGKKQETQLTLTGSAAENIWPLKRVLQHGSGIHLPFAASPVK
ncbi:hypothetical protein, partial [Sansalvadorimonas verongulae]|uniref:hypothetical protein n=1 Tax=Sansalvadorimonas verongulae TaxID=2172824 RepID=UPI001E3D6BD1